MVAPIEETTGTVVAPGVYDDIAKDEAVVHPLTGVKIVGFEVPFWSECLDLAREAALHDLSNRSIGWDIAVTANGPGLLEGNHDWCKLVWQLPVRQGLRSMLDRHWEDYTAIVESHE